MEARPVSFSRTNLTELMIPAFANFGGKVHGGIILSLMDKAAYACAMKHAGNYCVTVTVDGVEFLHPVEVGELVSLDASVQYVGNTSLVVGIRVIAEDVKTHTVTHTNNSYFTMVAKDENGKPTPVPKLVLENMEDIKRFVAAMKRAKVKREANEKLRLADGDFIREEDMAMLKGQRCEMSMNAS